MSRIWIVARHEYATNVRRIGFLIFTFGVPLLGAALLTITSLFSGQVGGFVEDQFVGDAGENQSIGVVDESGRLAPLLPGYTEQYELLGSREAGREALRGGSIDRLLVVPQDYLESGRVRVVSKGEQSGAVDVGLQSAGVYNFLVDHLLRDRASPELRDRVADPFQPVEVSLDGGDTGGGFRGIVLLVHLEPPARGYHLYLGGLSFAGGIEGEDEPHRRDHYFVHNAAAVAHREDHRFRGAGVDAGPDLVRLVLRAGARRHHGVRPL